MLKPLSGHPSQMLQPERFAQKGTGIECDYLQWKNSTQDSNEQEFKNHHPSQSLKVQNLCHDQVKNVIHVAPAGDKGMRSRSFGWRDHPSHFPKERWNMETMETVECFPQFFPWCRFHCCSCLEHGSAFLGTRHISLSRKTPTEIESQWQMFWFAVLQPLDSFLEDALLADLAAEGVCRVHMPHRKIVWSDEWNTLKHPVHSI